MNKYIAILLLALSGSAFAETYLCIAEAGTGVSFNKSNNTFNAQVYDVSRHKFILSNGSGIWGVKFFGKENLFLPCFSEFSCYLDEGAYGGHFSKNRDNTFEATWSIIWDSDSNVSESITVMGRCSKI